MLFVSGGTSCRDLFLTQILSWDPVQEKWKHAGDLEVVRADHAIVAIPSNAIECAALA